MPYTKFQGHRPFEFHRKRILKLFTIPRHGGHLGHVTWNIWIDFRSPIPRGCTWYLASIGPVVIEKKKWMTLTFDIHTGSCTQITTSTNFDIIDNTSYQNIHCFIFFPYKSIMDQIWPCRKIGQGQPRVIIWTNLLVLEHPMLHTKSQGFTIYGHGGHLGHVTWTVWTNVRSPILRRRHMKFGFIRPCGFRGDVWKCWHTNTHIHTHTYPRTTEAYLYYKLTYEPKG